MKEKEVKVYEVDLGYKTTRDVFELATTNIDLIAKELIRKNDELLVTLLLKKIEILENAIKSTIGEYRLDLLNNELLNYYLDTLSKQCFGYTNEFILDYFFGIRRQQEPID